MELIEKLKILTDGAKYDVACTSSGVDKSPGLGGMGSAIAAGICHSFSADGRCIALLKVLLTNHCIYDCAYCVNRRSNDRPRAAFTPRELADLTIQFYRRNYIEGLFLSSGVFKSADATTEKMIETLKILREEYHFYGYIHAKAIPGADPLLLSRLGTLCDRMSVNIELPSEQSLGLLAPDKPKSSILKPMGLLRDRMAESRHAITRYRHAPRFAPAGQSTQMIIGATPDNDLQILRLSEGLYQKYQLKRVFFSAYLPVNNAPNLPVAADFKTPLLREHRLYQADWLMRFYGFSAGEIVDDNHPDLHPLVDPKANWAIAHPEVFPLEVNRAPYELLLRVPGIGVQSARRILVARRSTTLDFDDLKKIGVVLKRAQYFLLCRGKRMYGLQVTEQSILQGMITAQGFSVLQQYQSADQLSLFRPTPKFEDMERLLLRA